MTKHNDSEAHVNEGNVDDSHMLFHVAFLRQAFVERASHSKLNRPEKKGSEIAETAAADTLQVRQNWPEVSSSGFGCLPEITEAELFGEMFVWLDTDCSEVRFFARESQ